MDGADLPASTKPCPPPRPSVAKPVPRPRNISANREKSAPPLKPSDSDEPSASSTNRSEPLPKQDPPQNFVKFRNAFGKRHSAFAASDSNDSFAQLSDAVPVGIASRFSSSPVASVAEDGCKRASDGHATRAVAAEQFKSTVTITTPEAEAALGTARCRSEGRPEENVELDVELASTKSPQAAKEHMEAIAIAHDRDAVGRAVVIECPARPPLASEDDNEDTLQFVEKPSRRTLNESFEDPSASRDEATPKMADHNGAGAEDMAVIAAAAAARSLRRDKTTATGSAARQVSEAYACSMIADLLNSTREQ
ncbi:hypothetical protein AAVH_24279, partial [Aphelenchoides avenae]